MSKNQLRRINRYYDINDIYSLMNIRKSAVNFYEIYNRFEYIFKKLIKIIDKLNPEVDSMFYNYRIDILLKLAYIYGFSKYYGYFSDNMCFYRHKELAIACFTKVLSYNSDNLIALYNFATFYDKNRDWKNAVTYYKECLKHCSKDSYRDFCFGWTIDINYSFTMDSEYDIISNKIINCFEQIKQHHEAYKRLKKLMSKSDDGPDVSDISYDYSELEEI